MVFVVTLVGVESFSGDNEYLSGALLYEFLLVHFVLYLHLRSSAFVVSLGPLQLVS